MTESSENRLKISGFHLITILVHPEKFIIKPLRNFLKNYMKTENSSKKLQNNYTMQKPNSFWPIVSLRELVRNVRIRKPTEINAKNAELRLMQQILSIRNQLLPELFL